jgi:hypothetical protein
MEGGRGYEAWSPPTKTEGWNIPGCGSIPDPGSRIQGHKDSGSQIRMRIKEFKYFNPKIVSKLSEI